MTKRNVLKRWVSAGILMQLVFGCPMRPDVSADLDEVTAGRLDSFASEKDFDAYVERMQSIRGRFYWQAPPAIGCASEAMSESAAPAAPADSDSITNNQEQGVDEGDIVKASGDFLVVLRRGRLFTVRLEDAGQDVLVPVDRSNATPEGFTKSTWYDEMLIHADRVIVIGFSYEVGATELGFFRLAADGTLSHEDTFFLRSNDYYSSRNYASRLVGGKLIFYMPYMMFRSSWPMGQEQGDTSLPSVKKWVQGNETTEWSAILPKVDVIQPVQRTIDPMLHTVVQCDLELAETTCTARAVLGPYARTFYVAPDAVYLWVGNDTQVDDDNTTSVLYRMPLREGAVTAARVRFSPLDQFSFKQDDDGFLNVLLLQGAGGDWMFNAEKSQGEMALLRAAVGELTTDAPRIPDDRYTSVPKPGGYSRQNRHVGHHVLWGSGAGWSDEGGERRVFVADVRTPGTVHEVSLDHVVDRIEVLGDAALVVGQGEGDLRFSTISLGEAPKVMGTFSRPDATQGETRSHGFFFKPDGVGGGILGLPVRLTGSQWSHLTHGSAEVQFLGVTPELQLGERGRLVAADANQPDDACEVSCVDWYGNARPIFLGDRVFALLGYELVEGQFSDDTLTELDRADFLQATDP